MGTNRAQVERDVEPSRDGDDRKARVFISYAREDLDVAESIRDALIAAGFDAYLDKHDIAPGEPWKERIGALIAMAEKVVFLISPDSVASRIAAWEVDQAEAQAKSVIPVLVRDTGGDLIPGRLRRLNYIIYRTSDDRPEALKSLAEVLSIDLAWERTKTRINDRAMAWDQGGRRDGLMPAEQEIRDAEEWRDSRPESSLPPTEIQLAYINVSRARKTRQRQYLVGTLSVGVIVLAGLSVFAFVQRNNAQAQTKLASEKTVQAEENELQARNNEAAALAGLSSVALDRDRPVEAAKLALASWPRTRDDPVGQRDVSLQALSDALLSLRERVRLSASASGSGNVAFSPDGTKIATGGSNSTARILNSATGDEIVVLRGHGDTITGVVFSPDGTRLATASRDGTARIWDAVSGEKIFQLEGPGDGITSVAFSGDGSYIATSFDGVSYSGRIAKIWDAATGSEVAEINGNVGAINAMSFSTDGDLLATGSGDGTVRIWDAMSGDEYARLEGHTGRVRGVAFSPNGVFVASSADDRTAIVWDVYEGHEFAQIPDHGQWVCCVAFSPDGLRLATATAGQYQWGGRDIKSYQAVWIWDVFSGEEIARLDVGGRQVYSLAFSPSGERLAAGLADGIIKIWDTTLTRSEIMRVEDREIEDTIHSVAFSPDGETLATGANGSVSIWRIPTGSLMQSLPHSGMVFSVAYHPSGLRLATASSDGNARILDLATNEQFLQLEGHLGFVTQVVYSPDGTKVATSSRDGTARIWDGTSGEELSIIKGESDEVRGVVFSPDGTRIAVSEGDGNLRIINWVTGLEEGRFEVEWKYLGGPTFSPDGKFIAAGGNSGMESEVRVWEISTGKEMFRLDSGFYGPVFSPDGSRIAAGATDGQVVLWDAATGAELARFRGHTRGIQEVAFSPGGDLLGSASIDGTARVWRLSSLPYNHSLRVGIPPGDIFRIACTWLPWVNGQPDYSLSDIADAYGIVIEEPICNYDSGYDPPLPIMGGSAQ